MAAGSAKGAGLTMLVIASDLNPVRQGVRRLDSVTSPNCAAHQELELAVRQPGWGIQTRDGLQVNQVRDGPGGAELGSLADHQKAAIWPCSDDWARVTRPDGV